jgi:NAD(P)H-nitrite reductase large subunit
VIATEKGWNLYICGNGGMRPQHAVLFAKDLDREKLVRYIDRFLRRPCERAVFGPASCLPSSFS